MGSHYVIPRPYVHEFWQFCFRHFDLAIWSTLDNDLGREVLRSFMTSVEVSHLRYAWGGDDCKQFGYVSHKSDKIVISKFFERLPKLIYRPENIIQIDANPSRGSHNAVCGSLFPPKFSERCLEDWFLKYSLVPHLRKLSNSGRCLVLSNKIEYPNWSIRCLFLDWVDNREIWENMYIQRYGDRYLIRQFNVQFNSKNMS